MTGTNGDRRPVSETVRAALSAAVDALAKRKAERLLVLDLEGRAYFTDHFVICHGTSDRQVRSLADEVVDRVKRVTGSKPSIEGYASAEWVLLDYGDFIVHIFSESARDHYRLESLWDDAREVDVASLSAGAAG